MVKRDATETKAAPVEPGAHAAIVDEIYANNPHLTERERRTVKRLATFYMILDFHGDALNVDRGAIGHADLFQKIAGLALRHESALGITKSGPADDGDAGDLKPIRAK